jgi:hypothetical protein
MTTVPLVVVPSTGLQPANPTAVLNTLISNVTETNPGYTANLPGSMIEDISSTDVAAILLMDAALVDLVNSLTPYAANPFLLNQLGQMYGVAQGVGVNTNVYVVFEGPAGLVISQGFTVTDGTYQYIIQDGCLIQSGGYSQPLYALATVSGSWAVPANTVNQLVTSVPLGDTLTVNNPNPGTPATGTQTEEQYRAQVIQSGLASSQGMPRYLKSLIQAIPGVLPQLVSVVQINGGGWEVIVGGGDPYAVAYAIYEALFDVSSLVGSTTYVTGVTNANPGVVTTNLNHGFTTGQNNVHIAGVNGTTGVNGGPYTVTAITENTFSFGVNTTSSGAYTSGGTVTPNTRTLSINISDYPDTYTIPLVIPPVQTVVIQLTWNTSSPNYVSPTAVAQLGAPALAQYVNSVAVGAPMNLFELQNVFQIAVVSLISTQFLTRMVFTVSINGVDVSPESGTGIIAGDPESYFSCSASGVTISQG